MAAFAAVAQAAATGEYDAPDLQRFRSRSYAQEARDHLNLNAKLELEDGEKIVWSDLVTGIEVLRKHAEEQPKLFPVAIMLSSAAVYEFEPGEYDYWQVRIPFENIEKISESRCVFHCVSPLFHV